MKPIPTAPTSPLQTAEMSALGQKQTSHHVRVTSALPPIADICQCEWGVGFGAKSGVNEVIITDGRSIGADGQR